MKVALKVENLVVWKVCSMAEKKVVWMAMMWAGTLVD